VIALLAAHPARAFADAPAWAARLASLGIDRLAVTPDPVRIATEGALWGPSAAIAQRSSGERDGEAVPAGSPPDP
jgi:hypothetical protein